MQCPFRSFCLWHKENGKDSLFLRKWEVKALRVSVIRNTSHRTCFLENNPLWHINKLNCKRSKGWSSFICLCWNIFGNTVSFTLNRNGDDIFVLQLQFYSTGVSSGLFFFFFFFFCTFALEIHLQSSVLRGKIAAAVSCCCCWQLWHRAQPPAAETHRPWGFDAFRLQRRSWAE